MSRRLEAPALIAVFVLSSCDANPLTLAYRPVTIPDPSVYLVQSRVPDGNPATPQRASDPFTYRRLDWPGGEAGDSVVTANGSFVTVFDYPPFGVPFDAAAGDGGEVYVIEGGKVRITMTQDGSKPGITKFDGPDGWFVFDDRVTNSRSCKTARIGGAQAYTCSWRQTLNVPFKIGETINIVPVDSIISEHRAGGEDVPQAPIERFVLGAGWGRIQWEWWVHPTAVQASGRTPPTALTLNERCPSLGLPDPPNGLIRVDCRLNTRIEPQDGSTSLLTYGWGQ